VKNMMIKKTLVLAALLAVSAASQAATAICAGKINAVSSHNPGGLYVVMEGVNVVKYCDFDNQQFRTNPTNCLHMASVMNSALVNNKTVTVYIDNAPTTACSSIVSWFHADVRYFAMNRL